MAKITPMERLYEFRAFLEGKIKLYNEQIAMLVEKLSNTVWDWHNKDWRQELEKDIDDWTKLKNEAEAALVFVKAQIAFEED